jgi:hypothetical protein
MSDQAVETTEVVAEKTTKEPARSDEVKTVPQSEVDRIVNDRLARERAKFADYGDLKAAKQKLDQIEAANASDLEKAVKAAREEGANAVRSESNKLALTYAALAVAAEARFRNPQLAIRSVELADIEVVNGKVDTDAIKVRLFELAAAEPYMVDDGNGSKPKPKPDTAQGQQVSNGSGPDVEPGMARLRQAYANPPTK